MTLGDRCDEIVRLIDETLLSVGAEIDGVVDVSSHPTGERALGRRTSRLSPPAPPLALRNRRSPR